MTLMLNRAMDWVAPVVYIQEQNNGQYSHQTVYPCHMDVLVKKRLFWQNHSKTTQVSLLKIPKLHNRYAPLVGGLYPFEGEQRTMPCLIQI